MVVSYEKAALYSVLKLLDTADKNIENELFCKRKRILRRFWRGIYP